MVESLRRWGVELDDDEEEVLKWMAVVRELL